MLYRFLCNAVQRDGVQPRPDLAFGLCCYVPFHNSWYGLKKPPPPTSGMVSNYLIVLALYRGREMGRSLLDVQRQMGHTTLTMTNHYASLTTEHLRKSQERFPPLRAKGGVEIEGSSGGSLVTYGAGFQAFSFILSLF